MKTEKQIDSLNTFLADVLITYVKLHNYHWNVKGKRFFGIHAKTEEYYNYFAELYDEVAERILQLCGKPIVTVKDALAKTRIKEEPKTDFSDSDVVDGIKKDFEFLLSEARKLVALAQSESDSGTEGMMVEVVAWLEKAIWMLSAFAECGCKHGK